MNDPRAQGLALDEEEQRHLDEVEELEQRGATADHTKTDQDLEGEQEEEKVGEVSRFGEVSALVRDVLEHGELPDLHGEIGLSEREKAALEVLHTVVKGTAGDETESILAEERLEMLNVAIAALQPALAGGLEPGFEELRDEYQTIVEELGELRAYLERLADAQAEPQVEAEEEAGADQDDDGDQGDPAEPKSDTAHTGFWQKKARRAAAAKRPPGAPPPPDPGAKPDPELGIPPRASTLFGEPGEPAVEPEPRGKSTVWDGE